MNNTTPKRRGIGLDPGTAGRGPGAPGAGFRTGSGRTAGIVLGVLMLAGLAVGGYAVYTTLLRSPEAASAERPSAEPGRGVADTQTMQGLLTAVQKYTVDGDYPAAEAILSRAVGQYPEDQDLRVAFGEMLIAQKRTREAYDQYLAALAIGPRDAELEYRAGMLSVELGEHGRAAEHFAAARAAQPGVPQYGLMLANEQLQTGETTAARATLLQVTVLDPDEPLAWGALANIGLRLGENSIALNHARRAIALDPDQPAYRLYEARALKRMGKPEEALLVLTALPETTRRNPEYLRTIGECFGLLGRPGEAAARYEAAFAAEPNATLAFETALWHDRAGEDALATEWMHKAQGLGHQRAGEWLAADAGGG